MPYSLIELFQKPPFLVESFGEYLILLHYAFGPKGHLDKLTRKPWVPDSAHTQLVSKLSGANGLQGSECAQDHRKDS